MEIHRNTRLGDSVIFDFIAFIAGVALIYFTGVWYKYSANVISQTLLQQTLVFGVNLRYIINVLEIRKDKDMTICIVVHHTSNPEVEIISYAFDFNQVEISYDKN